MTMIATRFPFVNLLSSREVTRVLRIRIRDDLVFCGTLSTPLPLFVFVGQIALAIYSFIKNTLLAFFFLQIIVRKFTRKREFVLILKKKLQKTLKFFSNHSIVSISTIEV